MSTRTKLAEVCAAFNDAGASYLVLGAMAINLWGVTRGTRDIDVLIEATPENARRILDALASIGFVLVRDLDPAEVARKPVTMIGDLYRIDIFTLAWSVRYAEAASEAKVFKVDGVDVPTMSIRHLIASKRTGRLQDAADIEMLEAIERELGA